MVMGGPGDDPVIDILVYKLSVFSPKIDGLIRELAKYMPAYRLDKLMNWLSPPPLDEMEAILVKELDELKKNAKESGWET